MAVRQSVRVGHIASGVVGHKKRVLTEDTGGHDFTTKYFINRFRP